MSNFEVSESPGEKQRIHKNEYPEGKSRLIDINELSHRTGLGKSTIWKKIAADELIEPIRVSRGMTRWLESDVDQWIANVVEVGR